MGKKKIDLNKIEIKWDHQAEYVWEAAGIDRETMDSTMDILADMMVKEVKHKTKSETIKMVMDSPPIVQFAFIMKAMDAMEEMLGMKAFLDMLMGAKDCDCENCGEMCSEDPSSVPSESIDKNYIG